MKLKSLANKTAVVTGASSGVGRAIALELAAHGVNVVLAARRQEALEEVANECMEVGAKALVVPTDTRESSSVQALAKAADNWTGKIDIWINNAGVLAAGALEDLPAEVNESVIRTNLLGYVFGAHAVLPYFKKQRYGMLINNISVGGWFPTPYASAYTASKFGLRGFSQALKGELSNFPDISVCDLYPAFLDTPGIQHAANYTGRAIKPAPPVYDPRKVAKRIIKLIDAPRSEVTIGVTSTFLHLSQLFFPSLSRAITASVIRTYLNQAPPIEKTSGNTLQPVEYGRGIDGGWRNSKPTPPLRTSLFFAAGLTLGYMLVKGRKG